MNSKPQSIAFYLATLTSGGAQSMIIRIANNLAEEGHNVKLLVANSKGPLRNMIIPKVNLVDFQCSGVVKSLSKLVFYLKKEKVRVLMTTQIHANIICTIAGMLTGRKTKIIIRESTTPSRAFDLSNNKKEKILYRWAKRVFPFVYHAIAVSDGVKQDMITFYGIKSSKVSRIYNPILDEKLHEKAKENIIHPWLNLGVPIISSVSRIAPTKDIATMIRAFSIVKSKGYDAKFFIIGEYEEHPNYYKEQKELINELNLEEDITFLGFQDNPYKWLVRTDIYLSASLLEGLPGSIIQALALGCKMVVTNCRSGSKEVLCNGKFGILVEEQDHKAMAEGIIYHLERKHKFSKAEKEIHLQKFTRETNMRAYCSFLLEK